MKTLVVPVIWDTLGGFCPEFVRLDFTEDDVKRIKRLMKIVEAENLASIRIEFSAEYFEDKECKKEEDFESDVHNLIIYNDCVYFYAQHKHESSSQIESGEITIEEMETGVYNEDKYSD